MTVKTEAAALVATVRESQKIEDNRIILETSEGQIKFEQVTRNFWSAFPVESHYWSLKTQKRNEINGVGITGADTDESISHKIALVINRMRIANKARAAVEAARAQA